MIDRLAPDHPSTEFEVLNWLDPCRALRIASSGNPQQLHVQDVQIP